MRCDAGQVVVHGGLPAVLALAAREVGAVAEADAEDAQACVVIMMRCGVMWCGVV